MYDTQWLANWLFDNHSDWLVVCMILSDWLIDYLTITVIGWSVGKQSQWLANWLLYNYSDWLFGCMTVIGWLVVWRSHRLANWLYDTQWLADCIYNTYSDWPGSPCALRAAAWAMSFADCSSALMLFACCISNTVSSQKLTNDSSFSLSPPSFTTLCRNERFDSCKK